MKNPVILLSLLSFLSCGAAPARGPAARGSEPPAEAAPAPSVVAAAPEGTLASVPDVAEKAVKAVVNISTTRTEHIDPRMLPFYNDPFFRQFFGGPGMPRVPTERQERSLGSGVIVRKDGVILTNNHVVGDADEIEVTLHDGRTFEAEVVGTDPKSDVAVVRLKDGPKEDLPVLPFGDSSALRLGETVLAIGDPFGIGQTVTMGIVSATGRANLGIVDYEDFIQTDAAINPGNSGGALVNMKGELVGINTAIFSRSGGYQGIGFAIPSDMARAIMADLLGDGKVDRGFLGVMIQDLDEDLAQAMDLDTTEGVLVGDVTEDSPAAKAGVKRGDVILKFNGKPMKDTHELRMAVAEAGPGTPFTLEVLRDGRHKTLEGTLDRLEDEQPERIADKASALEGLTVGPLDEEARQHYEIPERIRDGVVVRDVEAGSRAARAGLREGDVILEVNRHPVSSVSDFEKEVAHGKGRTLLLVARGGATLFLVLPK